MTTSASRGSEPNRFISLSHKERKNKEISVWSQTNGLLANQPISDWLAVRAPFLRSLSFFFFFFVFPFRLGCTGLALLGKLPA